MSICGWAVVGVGEREGMRENKRTVMKRLSIFFLKLFNTAKYMHYMHISMDNFNSLILILFNLTGSSY